MQMEQSNGPLAGIILAAGASTRFGSPKQAAQYNGEALIVLAARRALACCSGGVTIVAGAHYAQWSSIVEGLPVRIVHNDQWGTGMASSIRAGMTAVPESCAAVLLMLCDQPAVTTADLGRLVSAWRCRPESIAAACYAGCLGVPAIFPRPHWPALRALRGESGARSIIRCAPSVSAVDMPTAAHDIDTPGQL